MASFRTFSVAFLILLTSSVFAKDTINTNNPPLHCPSGQHVVHQHPRRAYIRADGRHFSATTVHTHCADNPLGYSIWSSRVKEGSPSNWPRAEEKAIQWSVEERERTYEALSYLPELFRDKAKIDGLYRMQRSMDFPNPATSDRMNHIVLYDTAFDESRNLSQILAHEFAHQAYYGFSPTDRTSYEMIAGWFNYGTPQHPDWRCVRGKFYKPGNETNQEEDFANNTEYFLFHPNEAQREMPSVYNWFKRHFGASFKIGKGSPQ